MPVLMLHFVYGLTDPRLKGVNAVKYIGITIDPNTRYHRHLMCHPSDPDEKNAWVRGLHKVSLEPGIDIFEIYKAPKGDRVLALERETYWIHHYVNLGADLLNINKMPFFKESSERLSDLSEKELVKFDLDLETARDIDGWFETYNIGNFALGERD